MRAKVSKVRFDGIELLVQSEANEIKEAWLPSSEWSGHASDWQEANRSIAENDELEVVPLSPVRKDRLVVSRKRLQAAHVVSDSRVGLVRDMTVTEVAKRLIRGTVAHVCPAIVPQDLYQDYIDWIASKQLSQELSDHAVLGKGDVVRGFDAGISEKYSSDSALIDLKSFLVVRNEEISQEISKSPGRVKEAPQESELPDKPIPRDVVAKISPVLLIDDSFRCRESIATMLTREGVEVYTRKNVEEAQEFLDSFSKNANDAERAREFKLAILDPNLEEDGTDLFGLLIAEKLNAETNCRVILMTGEVEHSNKLKQWPSLRIHGYLAKPFTMIQLIEEIQEACEVDEPITLAEMIGIEEQDSAASATIADTSISAAVPEEVSVHHALQQLARLKPGTVLHVFSLHPRSFRARSEADHGGGINWEPLRGKIAKSVIKDTAIDRVRTLETSAAHDKPRHFWTLRMMKYQSFLGEPVYVKGKRVALVAFHPDRDAFNEAFVTAASLTAEKVGRAMERETLYYTRRNEAELASFGMALASLAHELTSDMIALDANLKELGELTSENLHNLSTNDEALKALVRVRQDVDVIATKTRILRGAQARPEPVSIVDCLKQAASACRTVIGQQIIKPKQIGSAKRIVIKPVEESVEPYYVTIPAASLIIVFFNLYLNAAQQIDLASKIRKDGVISQSISRYEDHKGRAWARVRITDSGPGIHSDDWERVFEPGYTTKLNGSGLGLYICRYLLRDHSASIHISSSRIWDGTTVTVSLPLADDKVRPVS